MADRLIRIIWTFSFLGLGYLLVIHPAEMLWKINPLASIGWVLLVGFGFYLEMTLQEKYPWLRPH